MVPLGVDTIDVVNQSGWAAGTRFWKNEEPPAPFGGFGASSNGGHFGGVANLELWTEWQWMTARETAEPFPF